MLHQASMGCVQTAYTAASQANPTQNEAIQALFDLRFLLLVLHGSHPQLKASQRRPPPAFAMLLEVRLLPHMDV